MHFFLTTFLETTVSLWCFIVFYFWRDGYFVFTTQCQHSGININILYFGLPVKNQPLLYHVLTTRTHPRCQSRSQSPRYPCPAVERPTRTSGGKRSAMTGFLDFRFYCACVRLLVSTNGCQDSWTASLTEQVRQITLSQRSLLATPPLGKGNKDSGNEIALLQNIDFSHIHRLFHTLLRTLLNQQSRFCCRQSSLWASQEREVHINGFKRSRPWVVIGRYGSILFISSFFQVLMVVVVIMIYSSEICNR